MVHELSSILGVRIMVHRAERVGERSQSKAAERKQREEKRGEGHRPGGAMLRVAERWVKIVLILLILGASCSETDFHDSLYILRSEAKTRNASCNIAQSTHME